MKQIKGKHRIVILVSITSSLVEGLEIVEHLLRHRKHVIYAPERVTVSSLFVLAIFEQQEQRNLAQSHHLVENLDLVGVHV